MQSVSSAFTAEEKDTTRNVAQNVQVSWKKESSLGNRTFTIGVSSIGGSDVIGINPGAIGSPGNYKYFDESQYVKSLGWEHNLNMPTGGLVVGMAEVELDNTSGRFLPDYMGGRSELFTSQLPRRPLIINAGFEVDGIDQTIPQFSGILNKTPSVSLRDKTVNLNAADYIDFFSNRYLDHTSMFTSLRSDVVIENLLTNELGLSTSQYELDEGLNVIKFGLFETGDKFSDIIGQIAEAENANVYQDETGVIRFENRQHWQTSPFNEVQRIVLTSQVIDAYAPTEDHIINSVEVKGQPREVEDNQPVWGTDEYAGAGTVELAANANTEVWANFDDPMFTIDDPVPNGTAGQTSFYAANSLEDGSGTNQTSSISLKRIDKFSTSAKMTFSNNSGSTVYLTTLTLWGRPARRTGDIYFREERGMSITAYEERPFVIENNYIQDQSWAESYAVSLVNDFSQPESLQTILIRAIPSLQLGDLVSWQGISWRIFGKRTVLSASAGFIQELKLLKRETRSNFTIGVSTIGGADIIAA